MILHPYEASTHVQQRLYSSNKKVEFCVQVSVTFGFPGIHVQCSFIFGSPGIYVGFPSLWFYRGTCMVPFSLVFQGYMKVIFSDGSPKIHEGFPSSWFSRGTCRVPFSLVLQEYMQDFLFSMVLGSNIIWFSRGTSRISFSLGLLG